MSAGERDGEVDGGGEEGASRRACCAEALCAAAACLGQHHRPRSLARPAPAAAAAAPAPAPAAPTGEDGHAVDGAAGLEVHLQLLGRARVVHAANVDCGAASKVGEGEGAWVVSRACGLHSRPAAHGTGTRQCCPASRAAAPSATHSTGRRPPPWRRHPPSRCRWRPAPPPSEPCPVARAGRRARRRHEAARQHCHPPISLLLLRSLRNPTCISLSLAASFSMSASRAFIASSSCSCSTHKASGAPAAAGSYSVAGHRGAGCACFVCVCVFFSSGAGSVP